MRQLCSATPETRYRLSSIEPLEISDELLTLMSRTENLMPHLHIPLQSGDDDILSAMNRRYSREQFADRVRMCRSALPDCAIGIDVLVGFPGEKDHHFDNTRRLLEQLDYTYLHVFPYSKRPGTAASAMADQVDRQTKSKRVLTLRSLGERKRKEFYLKHCDTTREVLIESERDGSGFLKGFTDNYISLLLDGKDCLKNTIVRARLNRLENNSVIADIDSDACREK
jgi:threonylcarbamoyladenosine tRNA methylthiotransferase MtaB